MQMVGGAQAARTAGLAQGTYYGTAQLMPQGLSNAQPPGLAQRRASHDSSKTLSQTTPFNPNAPQFQPHMSTLQASAGMQPGMQIAGMQPGMQIAGMQPGMQIAGMQSGMQSAGMQVGMHGGSAGVNAQQLAGAQVGGVPTMYQRQMPLAQGGVHGGAAQSGGMAMHAGGMMTTMMVPAPMHQSALPRLSSTCGVSVGAPACLMAPLHDVQAWGKYSHRQPNAPVLWVYPDLAEDLAT